ncbi:uncharacterized protein L3040_008545 [Drepanopeziza brunnea f. sp. 'multigermtubi']|uniref:uncharacterized protein n=1 Tax=Drepanopeziza brunnea f. sp. 'multigermtubi' TaxID=698441 RepID=UPI002396FBB3|nr:hypothetical protein L3040_008545 [Drepanopeziza brunnea f. sp. 'multigermtubi']
MDIGDIYSAETPPPAESASPAAGFSPVNAPGPSNPSFAVKTPSPSRPSNPPVPQEGEGSGANRSAASGPANPPLPIQFPALVVNPTNAITRLRALIAYVQMIGPIEPVPCDHCNTGFGPWIGCVRLRGFLGGSCANCYYGSEGARCSFRATPLSRRSGRVRKQRDDDINDTPSKRARTNNGKSLAGPSTTGKAPQPRTRDQPRTRQPRIRSRASLALRKARLFDDLAKLYREEAELEEVGDGHSDSESGLGMGLGMGRRR